MKKPRVTNKAQAECSRGPQRVALLEDVFKLLPFDVGASKAAITAAAACLTDPDQALQSRAMKLLSRTAETFETM